MNITRTAFFAGIAIFACQSAPAAIGIALLDDFEDGTIGGWSSAFFTNTTNVAGGPAGSTRYLDIARASTRIGAFDNGADIQGAIDPAVNAVTVDMFRAVGVGSLDIRMVLFGPTAVGNRWTSTLSQTLPDDGAWHSYTFSTQEADLTQVGGADTYAVLTANLDRIMFRHQTGAPAAQGMPVAPTIGTFGIDNVTAVPEPAGPWMLGIALATFLFGRRRRCA